MQPVLRGTSHVSGTSYSKCQEPGPWANKVMKKLAEKEEGDFLDGAVWEEDGRTGERVMTSRQKERWSQRP